MDSLPQQHLLHSSSSNHGASVSEYYGKRHHSSSMNPPTMTVSTEHSLSHLPPILDHHLTHFETQTNTLSPSSKKVSDDRFINSFSVPQYEIAQQYLRPLSDYYHRQLAA
eukprot:gene16799-19161_t